MPMSIGYRTRRTAWRLANPSVLQAHIQQALQADVDPKTVWDADSALDDRASVVLLLLGLTPRSPAHAPEPCVILNKRSPKVRQPGDLCCPGGGVEVLRDRMAAHLLRLPGSPLRQWAFYRSWRTETPETAARLRLFLAAALREGLEEMRLNPLGVRFLGVLPAEHLAMFQRTIIPLVGWVRQQHFRPNWEVERIIRIPLRDLLGAQGYIRLRLQAAHGDIRKSSVIRDFPAFRFTSSGKTEILWGATYRITMHFLERVFGHRPHAEAFGEVIEKHLTADYLTGKG
jgi:hypothetical protein